MKLLLELSMECESLARSEAIAAAEALGGRPKVLMQDAGVLVIDTSADPCALAARLGLCHQVSEHLGTTGMDGLDALIEETAVPGPIRVRSTRVGEAYKDLDLSSMSRKAGALIGRDRGVDLHSPASEVRLVFSRQVHVGRFVSSIERKSFERRMNKHLPFHCPVSLHPKFARALVNLTTVPRGGTVLDPFCGTGAIVAEVDIAGMKAIGSDLSEKMIEGAKANLAHVGARARLRVCDVGAIGDFIGEVDGVATDPPYGRSTSTNGEPLNDLYGRSFRAFAEVLSRGCRLAVALPDTSILDDVGGFRVLETHALWVHRSLTRNFCVLVRV